MWTYFCIFWNIHLAMFALLGFFFAHALSPSNGVVFIFFSYFCKFSLPDRDDRARYHRKKMAYFAYLVHINYIALVAAQKSSVKTLFDIIELSSFLVRYSARSMNHYVFVLAFDVFNMPEFSSVKVVLVLDGKRFFTDIFKSLLNN